MNKGFEQLRVTAAYPNVNLKVVGTHSGISIGEDGPSQMSIEEIWPGLLAARLRGAFARPTRCRRGAGERAAAHVGPRLHPRRPPEGPGRSTSRSEIRDRQGDRSCRRHRRHADRHRPAGGRAIRAAESARSRRHLGARDRHPHRQAAGPRSHRPRCRETGAIVVAEEHLVDGGLGRARGAGGGGDAPCGMEFVGIQKTYAESATPEELLDKYGLRAMNVAAAARSAIARKR